MASSIQLLRSATTQERPIASNLLDGQPAVNTNATEPGLFFKASDGSLVKVGPTAITTDGAPPNTSATGSTGNSIGEMWLDKSLNPPVLKVYDGTAWVNAGSGSGGGGNVTLLRWTKTAVGGETSLSGPDDASQPLNYTPGLEQLYLNGVLLERGTDYVGTSGTAFTGLSPLTAGDVVMVLAYSPFNVVDIPDDSIDGSKLIDGTVTDAKIDITGIGANKLIFSQPGGSVTYVGGANIPLPGPGTGITSDVQDRLGEHISLLDFIPEAERAAIRDGSSTYDSTANVQAAINACQATGLPLYVPVGKYNITSVTAARSVNIFGDSSQRYRGPDPTAAFDENRQTVTTNIGSWFNGTDPTKDVFIIKSTFQKQAGWVCKNLRITGGRYGILTQHITYPTHLDNLWVEGQTEACIRAGSNAFGWTISNCRFDGGRFGVVFAGTGRFNYIQLDAPDTNISGQLCSLYNCWYNGHAQAAIYLKQSEGVSIIGGYFETLGGNTTVGWQASTSYSTGDYVIRDDQECMRCLTAGTSGSVQPTTTKYAPYDGSGGNGMSINPTETDGTVVWEILGQSAAVLVQENRGFRLISTQGERNYRTSAVCLLGRATHSYAAVISNNNFRQHFPAPGIKAVPSPSANEAAERVILDGNFISDTGPYYRIDNNGIARGWIISNNIYQVGPSLGSGASLVSSNILNNISQPGNTDIGYFYTFPSNTINNSTVISTQSGSLPLSANRSGGGVIFSGGTSSSSSSQISKIQIDDATATSVPSTIFTLDGENASLVTVTGSFNDSGTLRRFSDLLFFVWGAQPIVVSSAGVNSPATRNYLAISNNQLRLNMGSGTYLIQASAFGTNFSA